MVLHWIRKSWRNGWLRFQNWSDRLFCAKQASGLDVVDGLEHQRSVFPSTDAAIYKLEPGTFTAHMRAISQALRGKPDNVLSLNLAERRASFFLTFDDGGVSAYSLCG